MTRTRGQPKREIDGEDETALDDGNDEATERTTNNDGNVAFKSRIERFQYDSKNAEGDDKKPTPYKITRKRPLTDNNDVSKPASSPSPAKKRRQSSRYAPPTKYAHLPKLLDIIEPNLICVFVGTNPGIRTATAGHAYAHPSNLFWKLLASSGCTDVRLRPENDVDLPQWYAMGNTNIVERPSKDAAELSKAEMAAGTPILEDKVRKYKPEAVCIVGKGIWEAVWRWRYKREMKKAEFKWGWQDDKERMGKEEEGGWEGARVYVTSSTSGLSASLKPPEKEAIWKPFGDWVKSRRLERFDTEGRLADGAGCHWQAQQTLHGVKHDDDLANATSD
ncbi:uracil DNA N-glycosylase Thp1 [Elasticomyces elasticus]|nr:uracil DNA N-glycosylase Thp1 [Elasticomyces elasticus]